MNSTPTSVGAELEGGAELSVACGGASAYVKHVGGQRGQIFDISVTRRRLYDAITPLILILGFINKERQRTEDKRKVRGQNRVMFEGYFNSNKTSLPVYPDSKCPQGIAIWYLKETVHLKLKFCHHESFRMDYSFKNTTK